MKNNLSLLLATTVIFLSGCAPYTATVKYGAKPEQLVSIKTDHPIIVGNFSDNRGFSKETDAKWFGVIRNGFGAPIKTLLTDKPVSEVIKTAFADAVIKRKIDTNQPNAPIEIEGSIIQFECDAIFSYGATANLQISVLSLPTRTILYSKTYKTYNTESGYGMAVYGGYVDMAKLAERTLSETIDKFFADPSFIAAVTNPKIATASNTKPSVIERLKVLEQLKMDNLISDAEYKAKRSELIGEF